MPEDVQATNTGSAAQDATSASAAVQDAAANNQSTTATAGKVDELPEWAQSLYKDLRAENAKHRKRMAEAEKTAQEAAEAAAKEQGKYKELYEKREKDLAEAKAQLALKERQELQRKVAESVGLPAKLASKISGETEADMEADAKEMLAAMPQPAKPSAHNDARHGTGGQAGVKSYGPGFNKEQAAQFLGVDPKYIPD